MVLNIMERALELKDYTLAARRRFHQNPELGFNETETTAFVKAELEKMGVEIQPMDLPTGVVGVLRGGRAGSRVTGLRADMDALPIQEETGLPYASCRDGVMHACGHDGHTAALLGAARLLTDLRNEFGGTVKFLFQPGEETLHGANRMIATGALDSPKVDNVLAIHGWPALPLGTVGIWSGQYMASADKYEIVVRGRGGHGCRPHLAANPIAAAAQLITALQSIVGAELPASQQAVVSTCFVKAGSAFNVIPDTAVVGGTIRCLDEDMRKMIRNRIDRMAKGCAAAYGCMVEPDYVEGVPSLENDPGIAEDFLRAARRVLGEAAVQPLDGPVMGSEDFSNMARYVGRGALFRLGLGPERGKRPVLHNNGFDFGDEALPVAVAAFAGYVLEVNRPEDESDHETIDGNM